MNAEFPNENLTVSEGKNRLVTEDGYIRLSQISEEIQAGIRRDDSAQTVDTAIVSYLTPEVLQAPDFDAPRGALNDLVSNLASKGEQLGYRLGYQATYYGLGKGISRGQEEAVKKLSEQVQL